VDAEGYGINKEGGMIAHRIKKYKVSNNGHRGLIMTLPSVKIRDMGLKAGDYMSVYATTINGQHVLVLSAGDEASLSDDNSVQGQEMREYMEGRG